VKHNTDAATMSSTSSSLTWHDNHSGNRIEAGDPDDIDEDEFAPSTFDIDSESAFGSITSSVLRHSYENGRRVRPLYSRP
jgi:hypothetical protein